MSIGFVAEIKPNKGYGRISSQKDNNGQILGVHWLGLYLDRNSELASQFPTHLEFRAYGLVRPCADGEGDIYWDAVSH